MNAVPPNPDLLRTEFLGLTVRFDDVDLSREDMALFFAGASNRYGLNRLEFHADGGGTMSGPDGAEFVLRPAQAASCGVTRLGLAEGLERVGGLLEEAIDRYRIGSMWIEDVTMVAIWDCETEEVARRLLAEDILRFDEERTALLGDEELSVGLRLWRRSGDGTIDCALEPMHADPSKIYLRLTYGQPEAVGDLSALLGVVQQIHEFLQGPLKAFVVALARR
jgi:hypothetical protein